MIPKYIPAVPDVVDERADKIKTLKTALWLTALFGAGLLPPLLIGWGYLSSFLFLNYDGSSDVEAKQKLVGGLIYVLAGVVIQLASTFAVWIISAKLARLSDQPNVGFELSVFVGIWLAGATIGVGVYFMFFAQNYR
ncbi:hypothetical protein [Subtercola frigoramans]|uniref:DUF4870 domain-containing protein n=1 Tax=Subtercola frigoramans TaxID=120298 RepID=A0ABS2L603_9MICO|nr:hypothetical protein [Subtercola frigoramans]MBM7471916.1 hypothetical protein [Subtercola frigoramans]